jgi:hypothetical protein
MVDGAHGGSKNHYKSSTKPSLTVGTFFSARLCECSKSSSLSIVMMTRHEHSPWGVQAHHHFRLLPKKLGMPDVSDIRPVIL